MLKYSASWSFRKVMWLKQNNKSTSDRWAIFVIASFIPTCYKLLIIVISPLERRSFHKTGLFIQVKDTSSVKTERKQGKPTTTRMKWAWCPPRPFPEPSYRELKSCPFWWTMMGHKIGENVNCRQWREIFDTGWILPQITHMMFVNLKD